MRTLVVVALAAVLSCQSGVQAPAAQGPAGGEVKFRILHAGNLAAHEGSNYRTTYAPTAEAYARAWSSIGGGGEPPPIDFTREAALIIVSGMRPTGGWSIAFNGARKEGNTLVIDATVTRPGPDEMVTQALTSPYIVVAVEKVDVDRVIWRNAPPGTGGRVTQ